MCSFEKKKFKIYFQSTKKKRKENYKYYTIMYVRKIPILTNNLQQLDGKFKYGEFSGEWSEGFCKKGLIHGFVRKYDSKDRMVFFGFYQNGIPSGVCFKIIPNGGIICGVVDEKSGDFSGSEIAYLFPNFKTAFVGEFSENGQLVQGQATTLECYVVENGILIPLFKDPTGPMYYSDVADFETMSMSPMLMDPYESDTVEVRPSKVDGANEGLFARRYIPPNTYISWYNGLRRYPKTKWKKTDWVVSAYRIEDPTRDKGSLDIPGEFRDFKNYCASLAHKTNHSFLPSAEIDDFVHPRFGLIPCIVSITEIDVDEEIFIHYGYGLNHCPDWYVDAWSKGEYPIPESFKEWHNKVVESSTDDDDETTEI